MSSGVQALACEPSELLRQLTPLASVSLGVQALACEFVPLAA
jgi:hypothetical protein